MSIINFIDKLKPFSSKTFVFTDIHGCAEEFADLLKQLPLSSHSRLIFLGDYIDRGPDSAKVVEIIIQLSKKYPTITLMGNHERMFLDFLNNSNSDESSLFSINGGTATLASYNRDQKGYHIPEHHLSFFNNLKMYHIEQDHIFVHAGCPDIEVEDFDHYRHPLEFLWVRDKFFNSHFNWGKTVVHGHTPVKDCLISDRRINVDTGCAFGNKLSALELPSNKIYQVNKKSIFRNIFYKVDGSARRSERFKISLPVNLKFQGQHYNCKAVDFSATGTMLIVEEFNHVPKYQVENPIKGILGIKDKDSIEFEGIIKRVIKKEETLFYGVEFIHPPTSVSY